VATHIASAQTDKVRGFPGMTSLTLNGVEVFHHRISDVPD